MDVDSPTPSSRLPQLPGSLLRAHLNVAAVAAGPRSMRDLFTLLERYFCDEEVRAVLDTVRRHHHTAASTAPATAATASSSRGPAPTAALLCADPAHRPTAAAEDPDGAGWVPLALLCSFRAARALHAKPADLASAAAAVPAVVFELAPAACCLRRCATFRLPSPADVIAASMRAELAPPTLSCASSACRWTRLSLSSLRCSRPSPRRPCRIFGWQSRTEKSRIAYVSCPDQAAVVRMLSKPLSLDGSPLILSPHNTGPTPQPSATDSVGGSQPQPQSVSARSAPLKALGAHTGAARASALLGYPVNRMLTCSRPSTDAPPLAIAAVKAAFDRFAPVGAVYLDRPGAPVYVKLKAPVAAEIAEVINRQGGIELSGEVLAVRALHGEAERLFHEVKQAKGGDAAYQTLTAAAVAEREARRAAAATTARRLRRGRHLLYRRDGRAGAGSASAAAGGGPRKRTRAPDGELTATEGALSGGSAAAVASAGAAPAWRRTAVPRPKKVRLDDVAAMLEKL
ncbi:hypothetical protein HK405_005097 [Cladochytrium tenue]|nr:hypothetical protein HK405_005097 [Cladochytrium tenue]